MTNKIICIVVTFLHLTSRYSLFVDQNIEMCPPGATPAIASVLILTSLSILLINNNIFPEQYYVTSLVLVSYLLETVMVILAIEFGMCLVWCKTERNIHLIMKYLLMEGRMNLYYDMGGSAFVGFIISIIAFAVFANICIVTGTFSFVRKIAFWIYDLILAKFERIWNSFEFQSCNEYYTGDQQQEVTNPVNKCCSKSKLCSHSKHPMTEKPTGQPRRSERLRRKKVVCHLCANV